MVINTYPADARGSSLAAAEEAQQSTAAGVPAHVEYRSKYDIFEVITDRDDADRR